MKRVFAICLSLLLAVSVVAFVAACETTGEGQSDAGFSTVSSGDLSAYSEQDDSLSASQTSVEADSSTLSSSDSQSGYGTVEGDGASSDDSAGDSEELSSSEIRGGVIIIDEYSAH